MLGMILVLFMQKPPLICNMRIDNTLKFEYVNIFMANFIFDSVANVRVRRWGDLVDPEDSPAPRCSPNSPASWALSLTARCSSPRGGGGGDYQDNPEY